jgi:lambda repressor-like predicted transcriptional regulator
MADERWKSFMNGKYAVSDRGRIMRLTATRNGREPQQLLSPTRQRDGYLVVNLVIAPGKKRLFRVHRIVAEHFLSPDPERKLVNHKNGKWDDNRVENLEWVSHRENSLHASSMGWLKRGTEHRFAKLTPDLVVAIRQRFAAGEKLRALAREFGMSRGSLSSVLRGDTWAHVPGSLDRSDHPRAKITIADVIAIRARAAAGVAQAQLCRDYGLGKNTMHAIVHRRTWKHVEE